jgi:hypothetical protein
MDIVISQPWGGLGDNLQFTTLPELYSKLGYKVYISNKNAYRNNELYDLIWKLNPFIEGTTDLPENAGASKGLFLTGNFIKDIEITHGLVNGYRKYPVIYYKPIKIDGLDNYIFYDITSISTHPDDNELISSFKSIFCKYPNLKPRKIQFTNIENRDIEELNDEPYKINNIYEFCDLLYSCKVFVTTFSGAAVLASTIKQDSNTPEIYSFYHTNTNDDPSIYKFDNANYIPF